MNDTTNKEHQQTLIQPLQPHGRGIQKHNTKKEYKIKFITYIMKGFIAININ